VTCTNRGVGLTIFRAGEGRGVWLRFVRRLQAGAIESGLQTMRREEETKDEES